MIPLTRPPKSTTKIAISEIVQAVAEASGGIRSGVYKSAPPTGHEGASLPYGAAAGSRSGRFHPGGEVPDRSRRGGTRPSVREAEPERARARDAAPGAAEPPAADPGAAEAAGNPEGPADRSAVARHLAGRLSAAHVARGGDDHVRRRRGAAVAHRRGGHVRARSGEGRHQTRTQDGGAPAHHGRPYRPRGAEASGAGPHRPARRARWTDGRSEPLRPHVSDTTRRWGDTGP